MEDNTHDLTSQLDHHGTLSTEFVCIHVFVSLQLKSRRDNVILNTDGQYVNNI